MADDRDETEDWETVERLFRGGASYRQCEAEVGGRLTYSRIRRRAIAGEWRVEGTELRATSTPDQRRAQTEAARQQSRLKWAEEKDRIVSDLVATVDGLVAQVFAPAVRKEVKVVGQGEGVSDVQIVDVELPQPTAADQKAMVTSAAILIDKIQLVTGEATSRNENGPIDRAALQARAAQIRDELAERRAARDVGGEAAAEG